MVANSGIDAMLEEKSLREGSLYQRIDKAVEAGLITKSMADWAHRVRLDANDIRHADETSADMTWDDAARAFGFAEALAEILYVPPSRMPPLSFTAIPAA
jgi:hypothetical protein